MTAPSPPPLSGARKGALAGLRRFLARAMAADPTAFVIPGEDIARARGLDLEAAGLRLAATPRHADVLLIAGPLPPTLREAAAVTWAQMPRPRALVALGTDDLAPLPAPDATGDLSPEGLGAALAVLRRLVAGGAFSDRAAPFDAPALKTRVEYTCPMHPEVVSDSPGTCPICGMQLVEREAAAHEHHEHHEHHEKPSILRHQARSADPGVTTGPDAPALKTRVEYTCPMHPEVVSGRPGTCPKCGMKLVLRRPAAEHASHPSPGGGQDHSRQAGADDGGHAGHDGGHDHGGSSRQEHVPSREDSHAGHGAAPNIPGIEPHFMSMVELTRGKPASPDGLIMEWIEVPFGPFFPGLPGGLKLHLTLDGDTVAGVRIGGIPACGLPPGTAIADLPRRLAALTPLSPASLHALAIRAVHDAAGTTPPNDVLWLERERVASHLNWLAGLARQTGLAMIERQAGRILRDVLGATPDGFATLAPRLRRLLGRVGRIPLLRLKLAGIGRWNGVGTGPVARAAGHAVDARTGDPAYATLGFAPLTMSGGDALARLRQRCAEIGQSLDLIARSDTADAPTLPDRLPETGHGTARIETPRGAAQLDLEIAGGTVRHARLSLPFGSLAAAVPDMIAQMELADALVAINSLDLDPWGGGT